MFGIKVSEALFGIVRTIGMFHEEITNRILDDLVSGVNPVGQSGRDNESERWHSHHGNGRILPGGLPAARNLTFCQDR